MGVNGADGSTDDLFAGALGEIGVDGGPLACLVALHRRPTREVFDRAARLLAREEPLERELGARILRELGPHDAEGHRPFTAETIDVVLAEMGDEPDPGILGWLISVLGYHFARRALDVVLDHQAHAAQPVRFAVAAALPGLADFDRTEARVLDALLRLARDDDGDVRWYALYALFNETAGVADAQKRLWAARLTGQADAQRREELAHIATTLDVDADDAVRDLLAGGERGE